jgi:hypothetical protein
VLLCEGGLGVGKRAIVNKEGVSGLKAEVDSGSEWRKSDEASSRAVRIRRQPWFFTFK